MSDGPEIISLAERRGQKGREERERQERAEKVHEERLVQSTDQHRANMIKLLDNTRQRVEAGELDGLVIAGRNPGNGSFLSVLALNTNTTRVDTYLAYGGILAALQLDCQDLASAGPHMNSDGSYFALGTIELAEGEDGIDPEGA